MSGLSAVLQVALIAILAACYSRRYVHPLARYPGPFLASITNLWKFFAFFGGQHHKVELKLHEKYGHVVRVGPNSLSFSGLSDFEAIYGFNKSIEKGDFYDFGRDPRSPSSESIFTARTEAHHREHRRKVIGPTLSTSKIAAYEPTIDRNVSAFLAYIERLARDQFSVNMAPVVHRFTFDTVVEVVYGEDIAHQSYTDGNPSVLPASRMISKMAWGSSLLPWLGRLMSTRPMLALTRRPTYDSKGSMTSISALTTDTRSLIFTHPEKALNSQQPSIVKNFLEVPQSDIKRMTPDEVWRETFNLVFAGPGSTAAAVTSTLFQLGTPDGVKWQHKIRSENGTKSALGSNSSLTAVIKETLRFHAPFPTAFPRVIAPGAERAIPNLPAPLPAGTVVSANTFVLGHSKEIWGEDAEVWRPDRWLADGVIRKELDESFVAFSKGSRGCAAKDLALVIIEKAVLGVIRKWETRALGQLKGNAFLEMQYDDCTLAFTPLAKE